MLKNKSKSQNQFDPKNKNNMKTNIKNLTKNGVLNLYYFCRSYT